jgi:acetyl-CoA carboxylase carboxyl transferase subunit alpha
MKAFNELKDLSTKDLIDQRMDKYSKMGKKIFLGLNPSRL